MVVMVIIGTLLGLAVLSLPSRDPDGPMGQEARRIAELVRLARDEAMVRGALLGLRVEGDRYRFLELRDGRWEDLPDDPLLRPRELAEDVRLTLQVGGQEVSAKDAAGGARERETPLPQVLIAASGELTDFELVVSALGSSREYLLRGTPSGGLELVEPDDV
jgi:general secretion pathway protein H